MKMGRACRKWLDVVGDGSNANPMTIPATQADSLAKHVGLVDSTSGPRALGYELEAEQVAQLLDAIQDVGDANNPDLIDWDHEYEKGELERILVARRDKLELCPIRRQSLVIDVTRLRAVQAGIC